MTMAEGLSVGPTVFSSTERDSMTIDIVQLSVFAVEKGAEMPLDEDDEYFAIDRTTSLQMLLQRIKRAQEAQK
jgi:hypothetical protein